VKQNTAIVPRPKPINLSKIKWYVVTKKNFKAFTARYRKETGGDTYLAISTKSYENLSLNLAELKRYIKDQKQIIIYYERAAKR